MQRRFVLSAVVALLTLAGCSDSSGPNSSLTREEVTGFYISRVFTTTVDDSTTDQLDNGGYVRIMLLNDELLALESTVPAKAINVIGEEVKTLGTWDIEGGKVRLSPDSASLMQHIRFKSVDSSLVGDATLGGVQVHLVMQPEPIK